MEIAPENVTKIEELINEFSDKLRALGGCVDSCYDNLGQRTLYLNLYNGKGNRVFDTSEEAELSQDEQNAIA